MLSLPVPYSEDHVVTVSTRPHHPSAEEICGEHRNTANRTFDVISSDGTRLSAYEHGPADAPTMVLVHGWALTASFYSEIVKDLSRDFRVISYDQRGHGFSSRPSPEEYTQTALAQDLKAVLTETLGADERVVLCGHSMGGMTVMSLAQEDPEFFHSRVRALLLMNTATDQLLTRSTLLRLPEFLTNLVMPRITAISRWVMSRPPGLGRDDYLTRFILRISTLYPLASCELIARSSRTVMSCPPAVYSGCADLLWKLDVNEGVTRITVPTHVIAGKSDRLVPPWHARRIAHRLSQCTGLTVIPKAGHMTPIEAPSVAIRRLRELADS